MIFLDLQNNVAFLRETV